MGFKKREKFKMRQFQDGGRFLNEEISHYLTSLVYEVDLLGNMYGGIMHPKSVVVIAYKLCAPTSRIRNYKKKIPIRRNIFNLNLSGMVQETEFGINLVHTLNLISWLHGVKNVKSYLQE